MENKYINKLLNKLNSEFAAEIIPVKTESYSKLLNCYGNVEEKVNNDGGKIHYGWIIHQTNLLCEAEHHAVWENEDEELLDITPNQSNHEEILFVSDNEYTYNGKDIGNIRINATDNFIVDDFILVCESLDKLYNFGERKDDMEIILAPPILKFINEYNELKDALINIINNPKHKFITCICGSPKTYKNCHHSTLKTKMKEDIKEARNIYYNHKK